MKENCNQQNKCSSLNINPNPKEISNDAKPIKSLNFNEEEQAAFNKLFASTSDDERRIRIRELMNATKKKNREEQREL